MNKKTNTIIMEHINQVMKFIETVDQTVNPLNQTMNKKTNTIIMEHKNQSYNSPLFYSQARL